VAVEAVPRPLTVVPVVPVLVVYCTIPLIQFLRLWLLSYKPQVLVVHLGIMVYPVVVHSSDL
jgi:hypothetical protein